MKVMGMMASVRAALRAKFFRSKIQTPHHDHHCTTHHRSSDPTMADWEALFAEASDIPTAKTTPSKPNSAKRLNTDNDDDDYIWIMPVPAKYDKYLGYIF